MKKPTTTTGLIVYQAKSGALEFKVGEGQETFLITQQQVAQIFDVQKGAISKHVRNIFESGELSKKATVSKMETVQIEGKRSVKRTIEYYDLDLVLSIGSLLRILVRVFTMDDCKHRAAEFFHS
jgi:hypothetical protein